MRAARRLGEYKKSLVAPTYIGKYGSSATAMAASAGQPSVGIPTDYAAGDLLVLLATGYTNIPNLPSGWTNINTSQEGSMSYLRVCYKIAGSSESAVSLNDTGDATGGLMLCFRGISSSNPINANAASTATGTTFSATGVTTSVNKCMFVVAVGFYDIGSADTDNYGSWTNANLSSITEGHDQLNTTYSNIGLAFAYGVKEIAGDCGATTATADSSTNSSSIVAFAIAPA